jgi:hypothetical protein
LERRSECCDAAEDEQHTDDGVQPAPSPNVASCTNSATAAKISQNAAR